MGPSRPFAGLDHGMDSEMGGKRVEMESFTDLWGRLGNRVSDSLMDNRATIHVAYCLHGVFTGSSSVSVSRIVMDETDKAMANLCVDLSWMDSSLGDRTKCRGLFKSYFSWVSDSVDLERCHCGWNRIVDHN